MANRGRAPVGTKGKKVPNLVMEFDNEKGYEFRVQCEIQFTENDDAIRVKDDVAKGTADALKRAKKSVLDHVAEGATPAFRKIVAEAFDDNIAQVEHLAVGARR